MRPWCVCGGSEGKAVVVGWCEREPVAGLPVRLERARMILRWDAACGGLFGLVSRGPAGDTRISAEVAVVQDERACQILAVSDTAMAAISAWPVT